MPVNLTCPECSATLRLAAPPAAGKKVRCPGCGAVFAPPEPDTAMAERPGVVRATAVDRPARPAPRRRDADDDFREPRRPRRGKEGNAGLVIGLLVAGGAVLFLVVAGVGIVAALWLSAPRASVVGGGGGNFVPPNLNPPPPGPGPANPPQEPPAAQPAGGLEVAVIVPGVPSDAVAKFLYDKLEHQLPPNHAIFSHRSGGVMEVKLAPVRDPQAFASKINYATVTRVNGRVIYLKVTDDTIRLAKEETTRPTGPLPTPRPSRLAHEPPALAGLPGLALGWSFDEGKGTQAANAVAGRPPAVLNAAGWVPGVRGQGVAFKDPNSWVDLGPSDDLNFPARSAFALCGWVQPAKPTGTILSLRNRDDDSTDLDIAVSQGKIEVTVRYDRQNTLNVVHVAGGSVNDGNWHHFVLQRKEDGRLELYVDGAVAQDAASEGGALTTNLRALGRERYWTDKFPGFGDAHFEGCMDEVAVFKRALTPEEIRKLAGQP